jgi:hypothetical protein
MSISQRIRKQLEQPNGLTQEKLEPLAQEYSAGVSRVNQRLNECIGLIRRGLRSEALQRARMVPNVLDAAAELEFPELAEWIEILQFYGIDVPENLDVDAVQQVNEALLEEQPLEELLRQHRRLAIAKAPLAWRLKILRHIAELDSLNTVWLEDIQAWETVRLSQIATEYGQIPAIPDSMPRLKALQEELNFPRWIVKPHANLIDKVNGFADRQIFLSQIDSLKGLADSLHNAFAAGNEESAIGLANQWESNLQLLKSPPPRELLEDVAPALDWVSQRQEDRRNIERFEARCAKLTAILSKPDSKELAIVSAYQDVLACQMGIDPLLDQRCDTRVRELRQNAKRKQVLALTGIIAAALMIALSLGLWLWNRNYRAAVETASARLKQLIEKEELSQASTVYKTLSEQSAIVVKAPEIISLKTNLDAKLKQEQQRAENASQLIAYADSPTLDELSIERISAAERIAKTPEEKDSIKAIRNKYEDYQRKLSDDELQLLRKDLASLESKLESFKQSPIGKIADADIDGVLFDIKALLTKYPKATLQGSGLVDLAYQRASSLRDSFRKQRREMERKQEGLIGLKGATTIEAYKTQLKKYVDGLPDEPMSQEFKESLKESQLWDYAEDWNKWCNDLALKASSKMDQTTASDLNNRQKISRNKITNLPGDALINAFEKKYTGFESRGKVLETLIEEFNESVIIELKTIKDSQNKRFFVHQDLLADILKRIKSNTVTSTTTIQVITDATGSVSNRDFRGKLSIEDEPRQFVLNLVRDIDSKKTSIPSNWDNQFVEMLENIVRRPGVDGTIKEMLFSRLVSAASESSPTFETAFAQVQANLNESSERRKRWFEEEVTNEDLRDDLSQLFNQAKIRLEETRKSQDSAITNLSKSKLVWAGGLLRDGTGTVKPFLYREDVPDGQLWIVVATGTTPIKGKLVQVGRVENKQVTIKASDNELLAGRPLFWTRDPGNSP